MATNYPDELDSFVNPTNGDKLNSLTVPHSTQHANINDAVYAIQAALGADPAGSALELNVGQVTAAAGDVAIAGDEVGEVDDSAPVTWFKFTINGVEYGIPAYAIIQAE